LTEAAVLLENLPGESTLFWRVLADNGCSNSISATAEFVTEACLANSPTTGLPINISAVANEYFSTVEITQPGLVQSVTVPFIQGTHFRVSDLIASIISPSGTEVILFSEICDGDQDFSLGFLEGAISELDCPPTSGELYNPQESLSTFVGEPAQGTWTLKITANQNGGSGELADWSIQLCLSDEALSTSETDLPEFIVFPNPAVDVVTIQSLQEEMTQLIVYDLSGRVLENVVLGDGVKFHSLDMADFAEGGYLIEVIGSFGRHIEKVLLSK
jgi:hypothetical protein